MTACNCSDPSSTFPLIYMYVNFQLFVFTIKIGAGSDDYTELTVKQMRAE